VSLGRRKMGCDGQGVLAAKGKESSYHDEGGRRMRDRADERRAQAGARLDERGVRGCGVRRRRVAEALK